MAILLRLYVFVFSVFKGNFPFKRWCATIWQPIQISFANYNYLDPFKILAQKCSGFGGLFLRLLLITNCLLASAQSFPVQLIPQVTPPPPIYFSQYADASTTNSPLRLQIILNDLEISNREIRLKAYFQGNGISFQSNDVVVGASPLFLEGGVPLVLTNAELAPYFRFENISGISPNIYGQVIPEGAYQFCYEVYDVLTGNRLSQKSCAISVVFQNEPPFLISPRNKTLVAENNPQNIVFQWTPRSINVSNVEYDLSLVEIWDTQIDPQAAFLSSPPVFQTTTIATTYVYGPSDPLLLSGKNYAWRIQAKAKQGAEEIGLFKNQGYSEIFSFSYAGSCDLPVGINHEVKGSTNANIFWDDFSTEVPEFTVRYRQINVQDAEWFLSKTTTNQLTLWDLKAGTTYEYQLSKKCNITQSEWSITKEFTTALEFEEESVLDCGVSPDINLTNMEPLASIGTGASFKAGDFPVKILEVSGSNGRFTGKGYVTLPYLKNIKVAVEFTNILINTDQEMAEGSVRTAYDADWGNILDTADVADQLDDLGDVFSGGDNINYDIDFEITSVDNIKIEDGEIIITGSNGETKTLDHDEGDTYQIKDASGDTYNIDKEGKITKGAEAAEGGEATAQNTDGVSGGNGTADAPSVNEITANGIAVIFKKTDNTKYDLDIVDNDFERSRYPKAKLPNGEDYYPIHKAVVDGQADEFLAEISISNPNISIDDLVVKTVSGSEIEKRKEGSSSLLITVKGINSYRSEEAIVTYKDEDGKYKIAASFFIHHIKQQELVNVVVVSVNGTTLLSNLEQELNAIYGKAGAQFKVSTDSFSLDPSDWDDNDNGKLDYNGSGLLSDYPQELKNIQQKYKQDNPSWDATAYHLFLLPNNMPLTKPLSGFMPKTRQWGYIFNAHKEDALENKSSQNLVAAHELGHGVFKLPHPSQNDENKSGSGTNWLMDYNNGDQLPYLHWAAMSDESLQLFLFQDEEDSEYSNSEYFEKLLQQIRCAYASGIDVIDMPEKYQGGYNQQVVTFNYGLPINESDINGAKITSGWFTVTSGATKITNIQSAVIDPYKGDFLFGNFKIDVPVPVYNYNNNITPFEDLSKYLFPTSADIEIDFTTIWNNGIKQKVESNQSLSNDDVDKLKKIASCGTELLSGDIKYKLLKSLLRVGWWTDEEEEDLLLDIIATTPNGNQSKELFEKINSDYDLLEELMGSLDDTSGNEDNFTRLGKELFALFDRAYSDQARNTFYNNLDDNNRLYFFDFNDYRICEWKISSSRNNNKFFFEETHVYDVEYNYDPYLNPLGYSCEIDVKKYDYDFNELIAVEFIGSKFDTGFDDGIHVMPASVYYILIRSHTNENLRNQFEAFMFVLGIVTPIDEFYLIGKALQYGNRGLQAIRFSSVRAIASANKIKVPLNANGKKLQDLSQGKVDNYVKFVDDVANGAFRFTTKQIDDYVKLATKNNEADKVMLGKYGDGGADSYIIRAGNDHTYFDLGKEKWKEAEELVNKDLDEMWKINKQFMDEQFAKGKEFYFSHEPWNAKTNEYLSREAEYLIDLGATDFKKINDNTWKVIW